jgi:glutathione synthase/RimK-type ligase-like ATP-grasp enzyme
MSNKLYRIYIGAICNRDLEIFQEIKKFCSKNYNISIVNLFKNGSDIFNVKYFRKKLKKYPISLIIVKLYSETSNQIIYDAINQYAPNIPLLNRLDSVKICESRKETFQYLQQNCKKLNFPLIYSSFNDAYEACKNGKSMIIKLDTHNIPFLPRNDRILGVAKSISDFNEIAAEFASNNLFFQDYIEGSKIVYKIYIIDRWAVSITSYNRIQDKKEISPLDLIHMRVPIDKQLKRRILRLGRKLGMAIFGIDYILSNDGTPYIVDINDFPSFRSIPEAVSLISDYIYNILLVRGLIYKASVKVQG